MSIIEWTIVAHVVAVWLCNLIQLLFSGELPKGKEHLFEGPI